MTDNERVEEINQWKRNGFQPRQDDTDWLISQHEVAKEREKELEKGLKPLADHAARIEANGGGAESALFVQHAALGCAITEHNCFEAKRLLDAKRGGE